MHVATHEVKPQFWGNEVITIAYVQTQIPIKAISSMTLKEVWCGNKPSINRWCVFNCVVSIHVPKESRS